MFHTEMHSCPAAVCIWHKDRLIVADKDLLHTSLVHLFSSCFLCPRHNKNLLDKGPWMEGVLCRMVLLRKDQSLCSHVCQIENNCIAEHRKAPIKQHKGYNMNLSLARYTFSALNLKASDCLHLGTIFPTLALQKVPLKKIAMKLFMQRIVT